MLNYIVNKIEDMIINLRENWDMYLLILMILTVLGALIGIPVGLYLG